MGRGGGTPSIPEVGYPPVWTWMGYSPPFTPGMGYPPCLDLGWSTSLPPPGPGMGYAPPKCEQTPMKTVPSLVLRTWAVKWFTVTMTSIHIGRHHSISLTGILQTVVQLRKQHRGRNNLGDTIIVLLQLNLFEAILSCRSVSRLECTTDLFPEGKCVIISFEYVKIPIARIFPEFITHRK